MEVAEEGTFYNWLLLEPLRPYFGPRVGWDFATASAKLKGLGQAGGSPNAGARS